MPAGQPPDNRFLPQERSDVGGGVAEGDEGDSAPFAGEIDEEYAAADDVFHAYAERLIQEAMKAGEFDDLRGAGRPIPGAGTVDDELWWVRSWLKRNQDRESPNSR